jgi:hypothetical protein
MSAKESAAKLEAARVNLKKTEEELRQARRVEREKQRESAHQEYMEFKAELLEELGIASHPKADMLFDIAWEKGHSGGYNEVRYEAEEMVGLIR